MQVNNVKNLGLGSSVVNLTQNFPLSDIERDILAKGLKFIPTPKNIQDSKFENSIYNLKRRVRLNWFFRNKKLGIRTPFTGKSTWHPHPKLMHNDILEFEDKVDAILANSIPLSNKSNFSKKHFQALNILKKTDHIIFKPADKGGSTVLMQKDEYASEAMRQLNDIQYYKEIDHLLINENSHEINKILLDLKEKGFLSAKQVNFLRPPPEPRPRQFYLLPKIHKPIEKWPRPLMPPGRPIVSDCGSESYEVAKYIDHFLQPLSVTHPTYIKDTPDFLSKIKDIIVPENSILFSLDVDSLYTNIDSTPGLKTIRNIFDQNPDTTRPDAQILNLLEICLTKNDFEFNGSKFLQVKGTSMGRSFAVSYANIVMAEFEASALEKCDKKPLIIFRFLDDYFGIWEHSLADFETFFNTMNTHAPSIKLKSVVNKDSIDFLDVTVYKGENFETNKKLDTKVFFKQTDTHELLHKQSFHPKHVFSGILKSQIIRFHRICNNNYDFEHACNTLFSVLLKRNYSKRFIRYVKNNALKSLDTELNGFYACTNQRCGACDLTPIAAKTFNSYTSGESFKIKHPITCSTKDIIYIISCKKCQIQYVGETSLTIRNRLSGHLYCINHKSDTPVARHFNDIPHDIKRDLEILPIQQTKDTPDRKRSEAYWIDKLGTLLPAGLNIQYKPVHSFQIPLVIPFCNRGQNIGQKIKKQFEKIQQSLPNTYNQVRLVIAYERNKNIKDHIVHTKYS